MTLYNDRKVTLSKDNFIVPSWILDDVGNCYPEVYDYILSENDNDVIMDIKYYQEFVQLRKQIYWLCNWYQDLVDSKIPVIAADLVPIDDIKLKNKSFLRFCNASPKDISDCIFDEHDSTNKIINVFKMSNRTNYMFDNNHTHMVIRPITKIGIEVRCVWHKYKLRAVSCPTYFEESEQEHIKYIIINFFNIHGKNIVFNSAIFDLNIGYDDVATIIEINSFGVDMLAKIAYFDWEEDFSILYNATQPIFKFKSIFEW